MNEQQRAVVRHMVEALEQATPHLPVHTDWHFEAIEAGKALLEQSEPVQEHDHALEQALTRLQKRYSELEAKVGAQPAAWVGLTDEEIAEAGQLTVEGPRMLPYAFARAIEQRLKEKNT
jgi:hypothetical protein